MTDCVRSETSVAARRPSRMTQGEPMPFRALRGLLAGLIGALGPAGLARDVSAQAPTRGGGPQVVLDHVSFWRMHHTLKPPLVRTASGLKPVLYPQPWLNSETAPPEAGWMNPDFDDGAWLRLPARTPCRTPYLARLCLRGKFRVTDPARVKGLSLTLACNGGAVVYMNCLLYTSPSPRDS